MDDSRISPVVSGKLICDIFFFFLFVHSCDFNAILFVVTPLYEQMCTYTIIRQKNILVHCSCCRGRSGLDTLLYIHNAIAIPIYCTIVPLFLHHMIAVSNIWCALCMYVCHYVCVRVCVRAWVRVAQRVVIRITKNQMDSSDIRIEAVRNCSNWICQHSSLTEPERQVTVHLNVSVDGFMML